MDRRVDNLPTTDKHLTKYKLHGVSTSGLQLLPCKGENKYPRLDVKLYYGKRRDDLRTINNVLYARVEYSPLSWPYCVHSPHSTYARTWGCTEVPGSALGNNCDKMHSLPIACIPTMSIVHQIFHCI